MNNILLSWSTLSSVYKHPCFWINKMMGLKEEENEFMKAGKKAHADFALKIKNKEKLPFDLDFQKAEVHFKRPYNDKYTLHGWADAVNYKSKSLLEIKTVSKKLWTNTDMDKTLQPLYYSYVSSFSKVFLLTCKFDLSEPKLFYREYTQKDWDKVKKWVDEVVKIIETTNWKKYRCDGSCNFKEKCFLYG